MAKRGIVLVAAFVVAALCCLTALAACSATSPSEQDALPAAPKTPAGEDSPVEASDSPAPVLEKPDTETLCSLLGKDEAQKLIDQAKTDADAAWIAAHPEAFESYGSELQTKLLKLAADDPLAVPFVRRFPKKSPADKPDYDAPALDSGSPSPDVPETSVPHLYQWDLRWGYTRYSEDGFGLAACGPTSMTMVYQGLTGKRDITPYDMGKLATENGYVLNGQGTTNAFFTEMPAQLGFQCWVIPVSAQSIVETLSAGGLIIANVGVGYFSRAGHFFVLAGLSPDGKVILNDPFSVTRSSQLWDPEFIASESIALYAYVR